MIKRTLIIALSALTCAAYSNSKMIVTPSEDSVCKQDKEFFLIEVTLKDNLPESIPKKYTQLITSSLKVNDRSIYENGLFKDFRWRERRTNTRVKNKNIEYISYVLDSSSMDILGKPNELNINMDIFTAFNKGEESKLVIHNKLNINQTIKYSKNFPVSKKVKSEKWSGEISIRYVPAKKSKEDQARCNALYSITVHEDGYKEFTGIEPSDYVLGKEVYDNDRSDEGILSKIKQFFSETFSDTSRVTRD